jgi:hypothetical protein
MKRIATYLFAATIFVLLSFINAAKVFAQTNVVLPGDFQSELGCPVDWMPDCDNTALTYNPGSGLWEGTFIIPAGSWQYKVAIDHSWNENYGLNGVFYGENIFLNLGATAPITFRYNPITHIVTTSLVNYTVTLAGSFQSELGCTSDWQPDCPLSILNYDGITNLWNGAFVLPAESYEFKVVINNSWNENYGDGGVPNGANIALNLPLVSKVSFEYNPITHVVTYSTTPETVVIPGTFQSELGCTPNFYTGDWEPACDFTRLTYDPDQKLWVGTFNIGAGHWEYKIAHNNSWEENYGLFGIKYGDNIPLDLPVASNVTFKYDPLTHLVTLVFNTTGVCVNKFYDANVNGYDDDGYPMEGVKFKLSGNSNAVHKTGSDGKTCFDNLLPGDYTVAETVPKNYIPTTQSIQSVSLGQPQTLSFGNVCLGGGGGHEVSYWMSKKGEATLNNLGIDNELSWLRYMNLINADGSDFDPYSYMQLQTWLQRANAQNMLYMLSAQMAAMFLNVEAGFVNYNAIVYIPGCGTMGNNNFMYAVSLVWNTNNLLYYYHNSPGKDPDRSYFACLKNGLGDANSNLTFVQTAPCNTPTTTQLKKSKGTDIISPATEVRVWPNPSSGYFTLRPSTGVSNATVHLSVFDVNGKKVYTANGNANKDYRFGQSFIPGVYMAELMQGSERRTIKLVKQ